MTAMQKLAMALGKRVDWNGPTVFGHGYAFMGRIYFPPQDNSKLPPLCEGCGKDRADPPSKLCPGCQAYREHQQ